MSQKHDSTAQPAVKGPTDGRLTGIAYSIVIVNTNSGPKLVECVDSLFRFTTDFEVIIVDNASTDGSISDVVTKFPETTVVRNSENIGYPKSNNLGIKRARGQWIVLLNPDTRVTQNWLDNLVKCGESSRDIGMVTPKLLRMDGQTIDSTGHTFNFRACYGHDRGSGKKDSGQYELEEEVAGCSFACTAIKKEVIMNTGLLDDKIFLFYEDTDYSIRARIAGWKLFYTPKSVVYHVRAGGTAPQRLRALHKQAIPYRLRIILKCYSLSNAVKYGTYSVLISIAAGIKNNDLEYFMRYVRSPIWNLLNLPITERRMVQRTRRTSDSVLANLHQKV